MYESKTQYVQDWKKFSIVFEEKDNEVLCTIDKDGRVLELKLVDEAYGLATEKQCILFEK